MTQHKWLCKFQSEYPALIQKLEDCSHHWDSQNLNPYHLCGDVFTHSMLVYEQLKDYGDTAQIAALLHDIGKPSCRTLNHEKKRVSFTNHEPYSAFLALSIMKDWNLDQKQKELLFQLICLHGEPYKIPQEKMNARLINNPVLGDHLELFGRGDHAGRFYLNEVDKHSQFRHQALTVESLPTEKKVTFLIGLPGSGKSTNRLVGSETVPFIVSRDDIIMRKSYQIEYDKAWKECNQKDVDFVLDAEFKLSTRYPNVIVDMTNLVRSKRLSRLKLYEGYYKKAIVFLPDMFLLTERLKGRKCKTIKPEVIDLMIRSFYPPLFDEGWNEIEWRFK